MRSELRRCLAILLSWPVCLLAFSRLAMAAEVLPPLAARFAATDSGTKGEVPDFQRHVVPLFGRLGCNGRACHGSFQGQGGFRLSMFGYDFKADMAALLAGDPPRVNAKNVGESLILSKPISDEDHGGGKRFEPGGWEERVLRRWILAGAKPPAAQAELARLAVTPRELPFADTGAKTQLRVIAHWSDGAVEDVTALSRYASNDDGVAKVNGDGLVTSTGRGATYVIVCYDDRVESIPVVRAVSDRVGEKFPQVPTPTKIDELIVSKLKKLGIVPSAVCSDAEFLRRASLDVCGTLPTPAEIEAFLADASPDKRGRKIDELLARPEYSVWWATLLCDLTGLNSGSELGGTDYARPVGEQWYNWVERRLKDNDGWDDIARGIILAVSRKPGQSYDDFVAEQGSYQRVKERVDFAAQPWMPYYWFRGNLGQAEEKALSFAHVFMGVRLDCAQCHKHPFDQWSQQDFKDFTAFFERVKSGIHPNAADDKKRLEEKLEVSKLTTAATRRGAYLRWAAEGKPSPFYEIFIAPVPSTKDGTPASSPELRILGGPKVTLKDNQDPREPLMQWLLQRDNPYFAPAFVNRIWAHYLGVGIVSPADDFNRGNPPSNRELMEHLASDFVEHGYDIKRLHRAILTSDAYQRSSATNETNVHDERLFSRAIVRRLPAEVVADALQQATIGPPSPKAKPPAAMLAARLIAQQPPAYESRLDFSMAVFGKPIRKTNCDCERQTAPTLLQAVYLRNDADVQTAFARADGWLKNLPPDATPEALVREAYLRTVSRPPKDEELNRCLRHFEELQASAKVDDSLRESNPNSRSEVATLRAEATGDVLWALLNTREFVTNH